MSVVNINGEIGVWFGVSAAEVVAQIKSAPKDEPLTVTINSVGGSVFDGLSIFHAIRSFPASKTTRVEGLAASMGSVIAMAGDTVEISEGSMMMIHNPWIVAGGDAEVLRKEAGILDKIRESLVGIYSRVTGKSVDELQAMMDAETWFTAQEAVDSKFAHKMTETVPAQARMEYKFAAALTNFSKAPEAAKKFFQSTEPAAPATPATADPSPAPVPEPAPAIDPEPAVQSVDPAALVAKAVADERARVSAINALAFDGFPVESYVASGASVADVKAAAFEVLKSQKMELEKRVAVAKESGSSGNVAAMLKALQNSAAGVTVPDAAPGGQDPVSALMSLSGVSRTEYFRKNMRSAGV